MLQVLLQMALHTAVRRPYLTCQTPHPLHVELAAQQRQRHDKQDDDSHPPVETEQEQRGAGQLEQRGSDQGDGTRQQVRHGTDILLHAVEHIAGMECLATVPPAFQDMFEQILPQSVAQADLRVRIETADKCGQQQLQDDASRHGRQSQDDVPVRLMGGGIYQVLAEPDEREGHADANCPGKNTRQNGGAISP